MNENNGFPMVPVTAIVAPMVKIEDLDSYNKMRDSVREIGFLHPISLRRKPYDGQSDKYELFAGKLRWSIAVELKMSEIPALVYPPETPDDQCKEIEFQENLRRYNLPWWREVELERQLHEHRLKQHGSRQGGRPRMTEGGKKGWSMADTARELGVAKSGLSQDIDLAIELKRNPGLKKVKDKTTALQLIKRVHRQAEAEEEASIPSNIDMNQVFLGDSLQILKHIPDGIFDACITDPPWIEFREEGLTRDSSTVEVFKEVFRVLKPNGILYAFVGIQDWVDYLGTLPKYGYDVQKYPLIWTKKGVITHGTKPWQYMRDYELVVLAAKGNPVLSTTSSVISAVFDFPIVHSSKLIHPNEKPVELIKKIMGLATFDGAKVLDPFAGSGSTLQAAKELGREYVGIERNRDFYDNIMRRLSGEKVSKR